jgi:hypothetical protein
MMQTLLDPGALRAANISPVTGLATDYLNHFNEAAMMVSIMGDVPELASEVVNWAPIGYAAHFQKTSFRARDLARAAYEQADPDVLARFHTACIEVERAIARVQGELRAAGADGLDTASEAQVLFDLIARVGAIINGAEAGAAALESADDQAAIDELFS